MYNNRTDVNKTDKGGELLYIHSKLWKAEKASRTLTAPTLVSGC